MLFGKISPAAQSVSQESPFLTTTKTCDFMTAIARPYALGASEVNFQIVYGTGTINGSSLENFQNLINGEVTLTSAELASWGTDDSLVLGVIAQKIGTTVEATYTGSRV